MVLKKIPYNAFFELKHCTGLRGLDFSVLVKRSGSNVHKNFFDNRSVSMWNRLPQHVVISPTVNSFKVH